MTQFDDTDIRALYQDLILDHGKNPRNFRVLDGANRTALGHNPLCGDRLALALRVDDQGVVQDAAFQGAGCAIAMASASMMSEMVKGKCVDDAQKLFHFMHMTCTGGDEAAPACLCADDHGRLQALAGVRHYPMRVKCATLAWHTLDAALHNTEKTSTE